MLGGHKGAVLDLQWSRDSRVLFSSSADTTVASWDTETGQKIRKHEGHEGVIDCIDVSRRGMEVVVSGSDDGTVGIWDPRQKEALEYIETPYPITAVAVSEVASELYTAGIDPDIKVWDMRTKRIIYTLRGHTEMVTSLVMSPDNQSLLSFSHDNTVRTWDIRPFAPTNRAIRTYEGAQKGLEQNLFRASWDQGGKRIVAGGGDEYHSLTVWDVATGNGTKLTGHKGSVNDVRFHPGGEPIGTSFIQFPFCSPIFVHHKLLLLNTLPSICPFRRCGFSRARRRS
jgi:Prp8 binding protein